MPIYSKRSNNKLSTCDKRLQLVFNEVIKHFDNTILDGYRCYDDQQRLFKEGKSQLQYPNSKHNIFRAEAVDAAPYPIDFNDLDRFRYFAGFVMGIATAFRIKLKWGGDWNMNTEIKDNKFNDLCHYELVIK